MFTFIKEFFGLFTNNEVYQEKKPIEQPPEKKPIEQPPEKKPIEQQPDIKQVEDKLVKAIQAELTKTKKPRASKKNAKK